MVTADLNSERALKAQINLYYDLRPAPEPRAPLLIALHGYGANKRQMMREASQLAPANFAIASLQGFHQHIREPKEKGGPLRFGFGWLTNYRSEESVAIHHQAILDLIAVLTSESTVDPKRIFLLGFSQSCALNYRFAFTHPDQLSGVVGICGGIPGDWDTSDVYKTGNFDVLHLAGTSDEFYPAERSKQFRDQLSKKARSVEFKSYDAGHEIVQNMRDDVNEWLARHASK